MTFKDKVLLLIDYAKVFSNAMKYAKEIGDFSPNATQQGVFASNYFPYIPLIDCNDLKMLRRFCNNNKRVEEIKLKNTQNITSTYYMCRGCTALKKISTLDFSSVTNTTNTFYECTALEEIDVVPNTIRMNLSLKESSKLTNESAKNVIAGLVNYLGTEKSGKCSLVLSSIVWANLDAEGNTAPHGGTWKDYVQYVLGWNY